jgi:ribosome-associated heat shock protein Hsp15
MAEGRQRVDKWLWHARVTRSRTLAQKLVTDGCIRVNRRKIADPAYLVGSGDVLTIGIGNRVIVCAVLATSERRGPFPQARLLYRVIGGEMPGTGAETGPGNPSGRGEEKHRANSAIDETKHS